MEEDKFYLNYEVIDFYYYYKEDIVLFVEMGLKCLWMFIGWSCIFFKGDEVELNEEGLKFYDDVFDELLKYGIELVIMFFYFEMFLYLVWEYGGFRSWKMVDCFVKFVEVCFDCYKDKVMYWMMFNEINNKMDVYNFLFLWMNFGVFVKLGENVKEVMY